MKKTFEQIKAAQDEKILIVAHRGMGTGNIPCNSIPAFEAALMQGADVIECDIVKSTDGKLFVFHIGTEDSRLGFINRKKLTEYSSDEIGRMRLVNQDHSTTQFGISRLEEVLDYLKGRCYINLDRCWDYFPEAMPLVRERKMEEQIIIKSAPKPEILKAVEEVASDIIYMPIINQEDTCSEIIEKMNINYWGAELLFKNMDAATAQPEYLEMMKSKGRKLWGNAIIYNYKTQLSAGFSDDTSLTVGPDEGWGKLADMGFDLIQTDWPGMVNTYLNETGKIYKK